MSELREELTSLYSGPVSRIALGASLAPARSSNSRMLCRALEFMDANLGERFTLEALAASAGISRFHFARLFRAATGRSPMDYLMNARVERSKHLLARGGHSICEIAAMLGFCDQSHFTRTFRRVMGISPRDYVRQRLEDT